MQTSDLKVVTNALPDPSEWLQTAALPYQSNPWKLCRNDILLFFAELPYLPTLCSPLTKYNSGDLDELYPSFHNLFSVAVQLILSVAQVVFVLSIPAAVFWPAPFALLTFTIYALTFLAINKLICDRLLNGSKPTLKSIADLSNFPKHDDEQWIFLNGVGVGKHWLQSNIDRIALSFGRPVLGVHNPTTGIVFDVIQCLIQRDFNYATQDIRNAYSDVKKALARDEISKVVFIVHSQGGIEGSLILDWLYADVPGVLLKKLEVYTFGNAANHFNNPEHAPDNFEPGQEMTPRDHDPDRRCVRHIEHYANNADFVSRWGVLFYASQRAGKNRYRGRVYESNKGGHLLNQHYLDEIFPLDEETGCGLSEDNAFMKTIIEFAKDGMPLQDGKISRVKELKHKLMQAESVSPQTTVMVRNLTYPLQNGTNGVPEVGGDYLTVGDLSRLWMYRNGQTPPD